MGQGCSSGGYREFFPKPNRGGVGIVRFRDGSVYYGSVKDRTRKHGQARLEFSNGAIYVGFYRNDRRSGIGKFIFADSATYQGYWKNGKVCYAGDAIYTSVDGYEIYINWDDEEVTLKGLCIKKLLRPEIRQGYCSSSVTVPCLPRPSSCCVPKGKDFKK